MDLRSQLQDHLGAAFRLDRELGGGGMSRVFVAHEHRLSRNVVVKVLSPELSQGLNAERFEREILLAASLQQANIVPVLSAGEVGGLPYFTMPFIEGESLRSRLTGRGLPINDIIAILRDVTKALSYAHARGIVHRDIKPDNVLLSGGTAVVTDFGIAKALTASRTSGVGATLTSVGTSIGTPAYMAPEQVAGDPAVDHRVDLYSLGCMAYELLTGKTPFPDRTAQRMLAAHLSESPPSIESARGDCPPALARLVSQLLAKDPADRPHDANEVLKALDAASTVSAPNFVMSGPRMFPKILGMYVVLTAMVALVARAAVVGIGLPEWTFSGAMLVMLLGLPMLLFTAWVKRTVRKAAGTTPTLTPGGTMVASHGTLATIALKANRYVSWRRTLRGGIIAMVMFALLVAGFMVTRSMGIGPAASLFASGALQERDRVLLADLISSPEDSALAPIVGEAVRAALSQTNAIKLLEPSEVANTLELMLRERTARLDPATAQEVALRQGAKAILGGRLARAGSGYAVSLRLTKPDDGAVLISLQATTSEVDLLETVDDLTRKLRSKLGESLRQVQRSVPLPQATTTSLAALRKFTEAARAYDVERDYDKTVQKAREAVALDSTFAIAWRGLYLGLASGKYPVAQRDSALENALRHANRLPGIERHVVEAIYYEAHSRHADPAKSRAAYEAAYSLDPTNNHAMGAKYQYLVDSERYDSALVIANERFRIYPRPANRLALAHLHIERRDLEAATAVLDSMRTEFPEFATTQSFLNAAFIIAYDKGDIQAASEVAREMSTSPLTADQIDGLDLLANLAMVAGRLNESQRYTVEQEALLEERGRLDAQILWEADKNIRFRGKVELGVSQIVQWTGGPKWRNTPAAERPYQDVIDILSLARRPDLARQMFAEWKREQPWIWTDSLGTVDHHWVNGSISMAEGNYDEAVRSYRASTSNPDGTASWLLGLGTLGLAESYDRAGMTDSAVAVYERYLSLPRHKRFNNYADANGLALVNKRLGEIYSDRGDRERAIIHLQAVVDQWQNADTELQPVVEAARAQIRDLSGSEAN